MTIPKDWRFPIAVAALLAAMGVVLVVTAAGETQTWDEGIHLSAGYSYLKTGDFKMNREHPPLFKLLAAVPLLLLKPDLPLDREAWKNGWQIEFSRDFMDLNRVSPDQILRYGRIPTMLLTLLLGVAIAVWTRRHFGTAAALGALFLYATDPNVIAHGRYVTNDLMVTLFAFAVVIAWAKYLETKRRRDLVAAGLLLGLALVSKFSALFLIPVVVLLYLIRWWQEGAVESPVSKKLSLKHCLVSLAVLAVIGAVVIGAVYGPETLRSLGGPALIDEMRPAKEANPINSALRAMGYFFDLPAHPYLLGLNRVSEFDTEGHNAYLLGRTSMFGWWYYFPVVFAVKTPTAVLLLVVACLGIGVYRSLAVAARKGGVGRWTSGLRTLPFRWVALAAPMVVYGAMLFTSHVNLGVRYLLPVYPFLFILLAAIVMLKPKVWLIVAVVAVQLFETVRIYPDYLAFFNTVSGGPGNGPRYLADSNIDWGQDLKKLRKYLESTAPKERVCFTYFGTASLPYYFIPHFYLPEAKDVELRKNMDCIVAISVTQLYDVYVAPGTFSWLREKKPLAKVGYSIYVYDLRKGRTR
ncbi:MAG: glycosyltransferase family 39 protein [Bryobacteraceae bacterium]